FPVAVRYFHVHVLGTQLSDHDFPCHLPDLTTQVVVVFSVELFDEDFPTHLLKSLHVLVVCQFPPSIVTFRCLWVDGFSVVLVELSDEDCTTHLPNLSAQYTVVRPRSPHPPAHFVYTGDWPVSLFPVTLRCLHVLVLSVQRSHVPVPSTQLSDQDFLNHLLDMYAHVVGQFLPSPYISRCLQVVVFSVELSDDDFPTHL
ncbi:unnamed protein product, partial [Prunus brigantina]